MVADKNLKGHIALFVAYIIFGLNVPIAKNVLIHEEVCSALALTFYRFCGAGILFWLASLFTRRESVPVRDLFLLFGASFCGIFISQLTFVVGLADTSPIDASVIATTSPIMTMILAAFFLKEPVTWKKATGVFIGLLGALLLIFSGNITEQRQSNHIGNLLCLLGTFSFAIYLSAFKRLIQKYSPITIMKWMFLFATLCSLPFCLNDVMAVHYSGISVEIYLQILYVVVLASFLSYLLVPVGQKFLRPTIVSMYNYMQPVTSSFVAVVLGMDRFGFVKGSATVLIVLGVYIVIKSKSYAQLKAESNHSR